MTIAWDRCGRRIGCLVLLVATGCGDDRTEPPPTATVGAGGTGGSGGAGGAEPVLLEGAVHKGPLVIGSTLEAALLDGSGVPTGEIFPTTTTNDLGEFEVTLPAPGPVGLTGEGFHYNEVTGELSTAPITLRAIHLIQQSGAQAAYVNVLTHLVEPRARELLVGSDVATAVAQAEDELVVALGIGPPGLDPGAAAIDMNLLGGSGFQHAYLFAVSATLVQAAVIEAGPSGSADGELQELINAIGLDFADGALDPARAQIVADAEHELLPERAFDLLTARLADLGLSQAAPDLNLVIDTDHDDVENATDTCPWVANPTQQPILDDVCHAFARQVSSAPADVAVNRVTLADLDGDTLIDAAAIGDNGELSLYQGDGMGGLRHVHAEPFVGQQLLEVGDFDGDAVADILTAAGNGDIVVYPGTGILGPLGTPVVSPVSAGNALAVGAIDVDGHPDVLLLQSFGASGTADVPIPAHVMLNDGNAVFTEVILNPAPLLPNGQSFSGPLALAVADLDADSDGDALLVGVSSDNGELVVLALAGDGSGALADPVISTATLPPAIDPMQQGEALVVDVTGDGLLDVVYVGRGSTVLTLAGSGTLAFGAPVSSNVGVNLDYARIQAAGDFTGDGVSDVVVLVEGGTGGGLAVLPTQGGGAFGTAVTRVGRLLEASHFSLSGAAADLDGNGADDLLVGAGQSMPSSVPNLTTLLFAP